MYLTPTPYFIPPLPSNSKDIPEETRFLNSLAIKTFHQDYQKLKNDGTFHDFKPSEDLKCQNSECLSFYSSDFLLEKKSNDRWTCPFCRETNISNYKSLPKIPRDYTFTKKKEKNSWEKKLLFVICLDFSGSMSCNYFRGGSAEIITEFLQAGQSFDDIESGFLVSRKELVLDSLQSFFTNLIKYSKDFEIRVFMILFNNQVQLLGDCSTNKTIQIFKEEELSSADYCFEVGKKHALELTSPFNEKIKNGLLSKLKNVDAEYTTALGPAVAAGLGVVESFREQEGFRNPFLFVFTDGKSNVGVGSLDSKEERKNSKIQYKEMNALALNSYLKFCFISFADEKSDLKIFSKFLLARSNGEIYQIEVKDFILGSKIYKTINDLDLEKYLKDKVTDAFEGKMIQASIYQEYGFNMKFHHFSDVNREIIKKYLINKKQAYSEGEPFIALYLDSIDENLLKDSKGIFFQIFISFSSKIEEEMTVFVSTFKIPFIKGIESSEENTDENLLERLIKREKKEKNIPLIKEKCYAILKNLKKKVNQYEEKKEEKKNEEISSESDSEGDDGGNEDKNSKPVFIKKDEKDSDDDSDGDVSMKKVTRQVKIDPDEKNPKSLSYSLEKEKNESKAIKMDPMQEDSNESSDDKEDDDHKTTTYHNWGRYENQHL